MNHDSHEFFKELFRDFSVVGEHFPMIPGSDKPSWDGFLGRKLTNNGSPMLVLRPAVTDRNNRWGGES